MSVQSTVPDLRVGTSYKHVLQMALPISAAILVPQINFVTNNIFLGALGERPLAIAGITGIFYMIFAVVGQGLNTGLQSLLSRKAGEQATHEIGHLFNEGQLMALAFSFLNIALVWCLAPFILSHTLHDEQNIQMAISFLRIRVFGLPFLYFYLMRNALLVSTQQTRLLIIGTATEALLNIFFDYTLIQGKLGFPALGFNGAAFASILAEAGGLFSIILVINNNSIIQQINAKFQLTFQFKYATAILKQSAPIILQYALSIIAWEVFYVLVEHHGSRALAISNTMRNIFGLFGCVTWAMAATTNSMVSNVIGQRREQDVFPLIYRIMRLSFGFSVVVCLVLNLFPNLLLSVYGQGNDFITDALPVLRVVSTAMMLMSISVVWLNAVTGTGNPKMNLYTELMAIVLYVSYVYIVMEVFKAPLSVGWASEWIYWLSMLLPSCWYMYSGKWKTKKAVVHQ